MTDPDAPRSRSTPALGALLLGFLVYQAAQIGVFEWNFDEGVYLAEGQLVAAGHRLYTDVKSALPPLLVWSFAGLFRLVGSPSVAGARLLCILLSLGGLVAFADTARRLLPVGRRDLAGVFAVLLLVAMPLFAQYGRQAMADVPALSLSLIAIALALAAPPGGHRRLALAGVAAGVAVGLKLSAVYVVGVLALCVLVRIGPGSPHPWRRGVRESLALAGGVVLAVAVMLLFIDLRAAYDPVLRFHWMASRKLWEPTAVAGAIGRFYLGTAAWVALGLGGLGVLARRRAWRPIMLLLAWEALVLAMLVQHAPLWRHLLLPLLPPLALAGAAVGAAAVAASPARGWAWLGIVVVLGAGAVYGAVGLRDRPGALVDSRPPDGARVILWLQRVVAPGEYMLTDDPMLAVRANRLIPADMTETSKTWILAGILNAPGLIRAAERDRPAVIAFWSGRFRELPRWEEWVVRHYVVGREDPPAGLIFVRPDLAATLGR